MKPPRETHPVLALVGAVVLIDLCCHTSLTSVLRKNRLETYLVLAWLVVHIAKEEGILP